MDQGVLVQFNLVKFVADLDWFSLGLLVLLIFSVTWIFSLLMTLRFDINSALAELSGLLVHVKGMQSMSEVERYTAQMKSGVAKLFFSALDAELAGVSWRGGFQTESVHGASRKFYQRSLFSARDVVVDALCARVDRAIIAGWGIGLLSLCAILIRSLMFVLTHGSLIMEGMGTERWLFAVLLYALIGVWGVCVTSWMCGFLKIALASIDQQLKRLCWRLVLLTESV